MRQGSYRQQEEWDPEEARRRRARARRRARQRRRRRNRRIAAGIAILAILLVAVLVIRHHKSEVPEEVPADTAVTESSASAITSPAEETAASAPTESASESSSESAYASLLADGYAFTETEQTAVLSEVSSTIGSASQNGPLTDQAVTMDEAKASALASSEAAGFSGVENDYVASPNAILVNADTNEVVAERDGTARIFPASMTKVMTILVAAEHLSSDEALSDTVTISQEVCDESYVTGSSYVGFAPGDSVTVGDLFYGAILPSGADAAIALADYIAGSEEAFADLMNEKAQELGISETTHFTNCVGTYSADHYTTARDMAVIMKAAAENDFCRQVLSTHTYTIPGTQGTPAGFDLSNWFLRKIENKDTNGTVLCGKTGYVQKAGNCAVSFLEGDDGKHYICVTARAWDGWRCIYDQVALYAHYVGAGTSQ
ncbi:MAG: D-alanyl-D-alanine carboxypeptidase family protein [Lachnospiraceae bacterium]